MPSIASLDPLWVSTWPGVHKILLRFRYSQCSDCWGWGCIEWREFTVKDDVLDLISRLSARTFLGAEMCRNAEWLAITKSYTLNAFRSAEILRPYPPWLRSVAHWFIPECKTLRQQVTDSRRIIEPFLAERRRLRQEARALSNNDAVDWFEQEARDRQYDPVAKQLALSVVAIHTTTDLLVETMLRIAEHPALFDALRKETVEALSGGWKKTALSNMRLMDSVLKEAQRLKPITSGTYTRNTPSHSESVLRQYPAIMARVATRPVTLPNGLTLQTGERCVGDIGGMYNPSVYPNPHEFDGYRFKNMRGNAELDSQAHLVSTSPSHLGFGHGKHACPGRFFASNELKVALAHLLMKYEWKLTPEHEHQWQEWGVAWSADDGAKLLMRKREKPEIDIDAC